MSAREPMNLCLGQVISCFRCPVDSSGIRGCSVVHYVCFMCPTNEVLMAVSMSVSLINPLADWLSDLAPSTAYGLLCGDLPHRAGFSTKLWCLLRPPFWCVTCGANCVLFCFDLKLGSEYDGYGPFGRVSGVVLGQQLPVAGPKLPGKDYKMTCSCLLLVMDLEVYGKGHAVNRGWLPTVLGLGHTAKCPGHLEFYLCLLAACKA